MGIKIIQTAVLVSVIVLIVFQLISPKLRPVIAQNPDEDPVVEEPMPNEEPDQPEPTLSEYPTRHALARELLPHEKAQAERFNAKLEPGEPRFEDYLANMDYIGQLAMYELQLTTHHPQYSRSDLATWRLDLADAIFRNKQMDKGVQLHAVAPPRFPQSWSQAHTEYDRGKYETMLEVHRFYAARIEELEARVSKLETGK